MTFGIRSKFFVISLGIISAALFVSDFFLTSRVEGDMIERIRTDLRIRADLAEQKISQQAPLNPLSPGAPWTALTRELGRRAQARVTLITRDGRVIGDSEVHPQQISMMENHGNRPEVVEALRSGQGWSIRYSYTMGMRMMYVAVPFYSGGTVSGTARIALPLSQVDDAVFNFRGLLVAASLLALVVAGIISNLAVYRLAKTLKLLAHSAGKMVNGDLMERVHTPGHDEIAILGRSLDNLAGSLAEALRQLKQEKDLLGGILGSMQEGVLVLDRDNLIRHANPALRDMLMLDPEIIGKSLIEGIRNAELMEVLNKSRLSKDGHAAEMDLPGLKPKRLQIVSRALQDEPDSLLAVFVDVTQIRRLENLRKDFVSNASHELRTPVASIRSAAETLQSALDDPDELESAQSFLQMIDRNATRLHMLVEDLLDLSRIESREFHLCWEDVALEPFVTRIFQTISPLASKKSITMECASGLAKRTVRADPKALEQILSNLVSNAVKYSAPGCHVLVDAALEGDKLRISVIDNGPGIALEHLPRLFERFYRVDAGRSREVGGTGLGLAIVKHLTEAMGGRVGVESEAGKGTCFSFTLPRSTQKASVE